MYHVFALSVLYITLIIAFFVFIVFLLIIFLHYCLRLLKLN